MDQGICLQKFVAHNLDEFYSQNLIIQLDEFAPDCVFIDIIGNLIKESESLEVTWSNIKNFLELLLDHGHKIVVCEATARPKPSKKFFVTKNKYEKWRSF